MSVVVFTNCYSLPSNHGVKSLAGGHAPNAMAEERKQYNTILEKFNMFFQVRFMNELGSIEEASKAERQQNSTSWPSTTSQKIATMGT